MFDVDVSNDDESFFTTPDLNELWEDIISVAGYNNPDVLATTKHDVNEDPKMAEGNR